MEDEDRQWLLRQRHEDAERERQAYKEFYSALHALIDAAAPLWHVGDGCGGEVLNRVAGEAHKRGLPIPDHHLEIPGRVDKLAERDGWECHYCGTPLGWGHPLVTVPQVEHRIPRARGGSNGLDNLVLSCQPCNTAKGTLTDVEFMGAPF